jgi:transcription antitermination protein NusB
MSSNRRAARACAVQILYPLALSERFDVDQAIGNFNAHFEAPPEAREYADKLVRGVSEHIKDLDDQLKRASQHWRLERMAKVDLTILRLAAYELLYEASVPHEVIIDEALELVKQFSTAEAASFVNGVLAPLVDERKLRQ